MGGASTYEYLIKTIVLGVVNSFNMASEEELQSLEKSSSPEATDGKCIQPLLAF